MANDEGKFIQTLIDLILYESGLQQEYSKNIESADTVYHEKPNILSELWRIILIGIAIVLLIKNRAYFVNFNSFSYFFIHNMPIAFYLTICATGIVPSLVMKLKEDFKSYSSDKKRREESREKARSMVSGGRTGYLSYLDSLSERHPEWNMNKWWRAYNGLSQNCLGKLARYNGDLVKHIGNEYYIEPEGSYRDFNVEDLKEMFSSKKYRVIQLSNEGLEDKKYRVSDLYVVNSKDVFETRTYIDRSRYDRNELQSKINQYNDSRDELERKMSFFFEDDWYLNYTVKEREEYNRIYHPEKYDYNWALYNELEREKKIDKIKRSYENSHTKEVTYRCFDYSEYIYIYCGIMIMSFDGKPLFALISKEKSAKRFKSSTGDLNRRNIISGYSDISMNTIKLTDADIINLLGQISDIKFDVFDRKPDCFTEEEWGAFIYGRVTRILKERVHER